MNLGIISLLLLAVAIAIGFFRKTNVGLVCIFFAVIIGKLAGIPDGEILKGFKPNLFINLMGVTLLFSILNKNGTIELLARKIVSLAGSNKYLIPIAVFLMGALLTGIGPGSIPLLAIMPAIAIPLARARGYNPLMLAIIGCSGCFGGRMSPITPEGLLSYDLLRQSGLDAVAAVRSIYTAQMISGILIALAAFVYYKGYRIQMPEKGTEEKLSGFTGQQLLSLLGLLVMAVLVIAFKQNVGLTSFSVSAILLMCHAASEKDSLKAIPLGCAAHGVRRQYPHESGDQDRGHQAADGGPVHLHEQLYRSGGHGLHGRGHEPVLLRPGRGTRAIPTALRTEGRVWRQ
mgnify:CR=1 FL=1